jgi:phytanoyl-CoA hydroxylase
VETKKGRVVPVEAATDESGRLRSDLWLDQTDAHKRIKKRRLRSDRAEALHHFVDHGYLQLSLRLNEGFFAALDNDIERLWERRPPDLAVSDRQGEPTSFRDYEGPVRPVGYRIPDLHGHSPRALRLYLHKTLFYWAELIFGQPAIAIQSLYFEYGSEQGLHRDPMFVPAQPPSHLLAAWIALEDIAADSGPLSYVPGSHRLPWIEFQDGDIQKRPTATREQETAWREFRDRIARESGVETFTCKRGDVFVWHAGLMHGGAPVQTLGRTRKSFVIHYSTAATYHARSATLRVHAADGWIHPRLQTNIVLTQEGRGGLDAPIRGKL